MSRFNKPTTRPAPQGPMRTTFAVPTVRTHEGAPAYEKDAKTELFQLAAVSMMAPSFYESEAMRTGRLTALAHRVALADPAWLLGFVGWLRGPEGNMRTASLVVAAEAVKARLDAGAYQVPDGPKTMKMSGPVQLRTKPAPVGNRQIIAAALQRADEPGEMLAYWISKYGRKLPQPVKRGVADAARRLYTEYSLLKYDTASHGFRFGDVLDLTHPNPATPEQGDLFAYALDRRHGRDTDPNGMALLMIAANRKLRERVAQGFVNLLLDSATLRTAGMTWEDALSLAGATVDKRVLWEAMIPSMGYMALLRNLRNFDEAGVSDQVADKVIAKLVDPAEVARSRQLPFRFYSAYQEAPSDRWKHALGVALDLSLANLPELPGRTLILIDTSGSMSWGTISPRSKVRPVDAAAVLGVALGQRFGADVVQWASTRRPFPLRKGASALSEIARFVGDLNLCGGGTDLRQALGAYAGHNRVIVLSDMQTATMAGHVVPGNVPIYAWDLDGARATPFTTHEANRYQLGGFTDSAFKIVPLLEANHDAGWPWEIPTAG